MSESFVDIDTSDAVEPTHAPDGEYLVRIFGFLKDKDDNIIRTNQNGGKYFMISLELPEVPEAKTFNKYIGLPNDQMDAKKANGAKWELESFKKAFGVAEGGFDLNELEGKEAYGILGSETSDQYGTSNYVKKWVAGA